MKQIPLSVPNVSGNALAYVTQAIEDGWVSSVGSFVNRFEADMAAYTNQPDAVCVSSGSAALHLVYMQAGIRANDLVLAPSITFIASINPIRYCNADPVFIDVDDSLCMDPIKLKAFLERECSVVNGVTIHNKSERIIRAVVVVHIFGNMADVPAIQKVVAPYRICVIEDSAEALGTKYIDGEYAGRMAGTFGDFGIYSFNGNKILTTGGGGCIVAKDENALRHMRYLSTQAKDDTLYFVHHEIGYNYRMTNLLAALGCSQLELLEDFIAHKHKLYLLYKERFAPVGMKLLPFKENVRSNQWFFSLLWEEDYACTRHDAMMKCKEKGIELRPVWALIHEQKPYEQSICSDLSKTMYYKTRILNIPCSTNLSLEDAAYVADLLVSLRSGKEL